MFFFTNLGFTQSHCYLLHDIDGFYQLSAGSDKSKKPINITGIEKIHLKCDCFIGSFVNDTREPFSYSLALSSSLGHIIYKSARIKLL